MLIFTQTRNAIVNFDNCITAEIVDRHEAIRTIDGTLHSMFTIIATGKSGEKIWLGKYDNDIAKQELNNILQSAARNDATYTMR